MNANTNVKMLAAVIGGSAVVAMGAVTMAITHEQAHTCRGGELGHDRRRHHNAGDSAADAR